MPRVLKILLGPRGEVPNNPHLPVLVYRELVENRFSKKDNVFESHFRESGWRGVWRDTIYSFCHFHSNAHEALGIARGSVKIELGGEGGRIIMLKAGDMILLPAGTGHKRKAATKNLIIVGCYPKGQERYNMCREGHMHREMKRKISKVPVPRTDPFYGKAGPLIQYWKH